MALLNVGLAVEDAKGRAARGEPPLKPPEPEPEPAAPAPTPAPASEATVAAVAAKKAQEQRLGKLSEGPDEPTTTA